MPPFLRLVFALRIRILWSLLVRWVQGETARMPLESYGAPGNIEIMMKSFQYRHDPVGGAMDYVSHPEYVQAMLKDPKLRDGDCDDGHWFVANALLKCAGVDVDADGKKMVYYLSNGFSSAKTDKTSAHCTCVYRMGGKWFHFDWRIYEIDDPNSAPQRVASRYTNDNEGKVTYWVWETVGETGNDRSGWTLIGINKPLQV
jgi:hypothetical protein